MSKFINSKVARYVIAAMFDDNNKAFLIRFDCSSSKMAAIAFVLYFSRDF